MNETIPTTPTSSDTTPKGSLFDSLKNKSIVLSVIFITITIAASFVAYFVNRQEPSDSKTPVSEKKALNENKIALEKFLANTSYENIEQFKKDVDGFLKDTTLSKDTRNVLLLRKATVLSVGRGTEVDPNNWKEAAAIFTNFIDTIPSNDFAKTTSKDRYFRDVSLVGFTSQQVQCCGNPTGVKSSHLHDLMEISRAKKYSEPLSGLLSLQTLLNELSVERKDDMRGVALSIYVSSEIISRYEKELTKEDKEAVLKNLKEKLDFFPYTLPKTYTDITTSSSESKAYYAYGYDIYTSHQGKLTADSNKKIDANYKAVFPVIAKALGEKEDSVSLNIVKIINSIRFLSSMDRRYGSSVDKKYFDEVLAETFTAINSSKDAKAFADGHFKNYERFENMGYLVRLAKKNKIAADYMTSIGIDIATIK